MLLWIFFPLAISLHNLEEAIWLPGWSKRANKFHKPVEPNEFYFAVMFVTILAYLSTLFAVAYPSAWLWRDIFHGFLGAMILNTLVPHLVATILLRRYSPGVITGLFLLIPVNSFILYQSLTSNVIQWPELLLSTLVVSAVLLGSLPLFFRIGKFLAKQVE
jgi:hypothetical protein